LPNENGLSGKVGGRCDRTHPEEVKGKFHGQFTKHYAVWENGQEVALLSLEYFPPDKYPASEYPRDQFPQTDRLDIYEIFVPDEFRNRGIGTRALALAEQHAREMGLGKTLCMPGRCSTMGGRRSK
jgi:GNAT superfamily N-acetyltransferase